MSEVANSNWGEAGFKRELGKFEKLTYGKHKTVSVVAFNTQRLILGGHIAPESMALVRSQALTLLVDDSPEQIDRRISKAIAAAGIKGPSYPRDTPRLAKQIELRPWLEAGDEYVATVKGTAAITDRIVWRWIKQEMLLELPTGEQVLRLVRALPCRGCPEVGETTVSRSLKRFWKRAGLIRPVGRGTELTKDAAEYRPTLPAICLEQGKVISLKGDTLTMERGRPL